MVTRLSGTPSFAKSRLKKLIKAASGGLFYARQRVTTEGNGMQNTTDKYAAECSEDYRQYRKKCRSSVRGDGLHDLWVKLAWMCRRNAREWINRAA